MRLIGCIMNVFHCLDKLGKSKNGVNDRFKHAYIYMPAAPNGSRFKYRRVSTLRSWSHSVDISSIDPFHQFQNDSDPRPSTAFMLFARCSECLICK